MSATEKAKQDAQRLSHVQELSSLFRRYDITATRVVKGLWKALSNNEFRWEFRNILINFAEKEGGKLTLTTVAALIGSALGGVGIAAMGGAIGIPLALLLAPIGYLLGVQVDSRGLVKKIRSFFSSSGGVTPEDEQSESDEDEITELLATLLSRAELAEARLLEQEQKVSELLARIERSESSARELESRMSGLEKKTADLETIISEVQTSLFRSNLRLRLLSWICLGISLATVFMLVWGMVKLK